MIMSDISREDSFEYRRRLPAITTTTKQDVDVYEHRRQ